MAAPTTWWTRPPNRGRTATSGPRGLGVREIDPSLRRKPILILGLRPIWPVAPTPRSPCPICSGRPLATLNSLHRLLRLVIGRPTAQGAGGDEAHGLPTGGRPRRRGRQEE